MRYYDFYENTSTTVKHRCSVQTMDFFVIICLHFLLLLVTRISSTNTSMGNTTENINKDGYGITWMYFPDGNDIPRRISLVPPPDILRSAYFQDEDQIEFRLFTKYNKDNYVILDESATPLNDSCKLVLNNLNEAPIKIVTHGWESSADKSAVINIKDAYLESEDVNVIGVDWSAISESILYPLVAIRTPMVGATVGRFVDALNQRYGISADQIHLIGHSLGAHVMGNAGYTSSLTVSRITGLDPARPMFEVPDIPERMRLDASDAQFVDVIHTCIGVLGVERPIGDSDYFPNNGAAPQPGCGDVSNIFEACSHSRSHYYFAESIRHPTSFPAYPCSNWTSFKHNECRISNTYLGEAANRSAYGKFYLRTNSALPYGRGGI